MKLIQTFKNEGYNSGIGPGLYDIHSPRVPSEEEMKEKVKTMLEILDANNFFINPDCGKYHLSLQTPTQETEADSSLFVHAGLKTRGWTETEQSLNNLVGTAKWARATYA
jgi:5-methyltetrahydropteroyltriglutamate--homocysteine methyltransferase